LTFIGRELRMRV